MMDEEKRQTHIQQVVRGQLSQDDMRMAFRSQFQVIANDERFTELLKRLEQAEKKKAE